MLQFLAAQPGWAGQIIPIRVQAGKGQATIEWVFDLELITAFIPMLANMQRLVDVGDEMYQPGKRVRNLIGWGG